MQSQPQVEARPVAAGCSDELIDAVKQHLTEQADKLTLVLGADFDRGLKELIAVLERCLRAGQLNQRVEALTRSMARYYVFLYDYGFMALRFHPPFNAVYGRGSRQRRIERALTELARFEIARDVMVEHFSAALEVRLHRVWRAYIQERSKSWNPWRLARGLMLRLLLADDLEIMGALDRRASFFQGVSFGLSGFYLLFESTKHVRPDEFDVLMRYADQCARKSRWEQVADVIHILGAANLRSEQEERVVAFVQSLLDVDTYPYWERGDGQDLFAEVEAMGLSRPVLMATKALVRIIEAGRGRRGDDSARDSRENSNLRLRRTHVAQMLSILAKQSEKATYALQQDGDLLDRALEELISVALTRPDVIEAIAVHMQVRRDGVLADEVVKALRESKQLLDWESAAVLLRRSREGDHIPEWMVQFLENVPGVTERADRELAAVALNEERYSSLKGLLHLCRGLRERHFTLAREVEGALGARVTDLLLDDPSLAAHSGWLSFLGAISDVFPELLESIVASLNGEAPDDPDRSARTFSSICWPMRQSTSQTWVRLPLLLAG